MNMSILTLLYRNGLWISALVFAVAAALLGYFIYNIIRLERQSLMLTLPLLERQKMAFGEAGPVMLCIKGPRFTTRFAKLTYEIRAADGTRVESRGIWLRPSSSGYSTATVGIRKFDIPRPGDYFLEIHGLQSDRSYYDKCEVVLKRPHLIRSVGNVIGIVFSSILMIGSMVLFLIRLLSKQELS
ncbi:MAG: hypothetical protein M1457_12025 [bacterium]|nr:hypothetical protein [bacterium]